VERTFKRMLDRRPNDVDNTEIIHIEFRTKNEITRITRLSIMKVTRTTRFVLLYRYRTHTFAQIFIECSRINYVSKSNCKNSMLFVRVIFVSGISNFVVTSCTVSISSTYCHELTARDAIFGLRNDNKYLI